MMQQKYERAVKKTRHLSQP